MGKSLFGSVWGAVAAASEAVSNTAVQAAVVVGNTANQAAEAIGNTATQAGQAVTDAAQVVGSTAITASEVVTGAAVASGEAIGSTLTVASEVVTGVAAGTMEAIGSNKVYQSAESTVGGLDIEQALESVIDSIIGNDFNQIELQKYIDNLSLENPQITQEQICHKIIDQKSLQSGLFGAVTGIGGMALLPVAIPANLYTSWKIQAATIRAIAYVYGYEPSKTDTSLVLFGAVDSQMQAFKTIGIKAAQVATKKAVDLYMTREILKSVFKLSIREAATKMAQKALVTKMIPLIGAPMGFGFDWFTTQAVGKVAIKYYGGK